MKERPILFSGPMVRAILEGRKTQTRRIVKGTALEWLAPDMFTPAYVADPANALCPYGVPGDRLWVKETHCYYNEANELVVAYRADNWNECPADDGKWKPSIFCTRAASRITLEVVSVRVERLQAISEADARDEGGPQVLGYVDEDRRMHGFPTYRKWYENIWESINGPGSWDANPWVRVVEFKRIKP